MTQTFKWERYAIMVQTTFTNKKTIETHNQSIISFFWQHIKPYKWFYLVMLSAPIITSFYPFAYNYAIKLFIDTMAAPSPLTYHAILFPMVLFIGSQLIIESIWRVSNIAKWKAEPYVQRSILLKSYDYVQHHSYLYFQDNFTGTISSKLKGILDGYDKFWTEMHHGLLLKILKSVVGLCALSIVSFYLGLFVFIWAVFYVPIMYKLSEGLNELSFEETESRHAIIGQVSDKISNIISLFAFASRKREFKTLEDQITHDYIPKQLRTYKYDFKLQIVGGRIFFKILQKDSRSSFANGERFSASMPLRVLRVFNLLNSGSFFNQRLSVSHFWLPIRIFVFVKRLS